MAISADLEGYISNQYSTFLKFKTHVETVLNTRQERTADLTLLPQNHKSAGVLFPLLISAELGEDKLPEEDIITDHVFLLLEKRSKGMKHHPGDLAFPGGTREPLDKDLKDTAYREAHEEVGIDPNKLEFIAYMDEFISSSKILVRPVVSWFQTDFDKNSMVEKAVSSYYPKTTESEATVVIPLSHLLDPKYYSSRPYKRNGKTRGFIRYFSVDPYLEDDQIWGLTATMIRRFLDITFPNNNLPKEEMS